ncbi:MAG: nucleotidyl transferase AbiEii/AbiGii toxin family protein [Clostridia bacterium]|nr:nucleotidyl transferase AbiEii/AbiGii toxin family protein [Clostridia bacterium]
MITNNPMQLKAYIKKMSSEKKISAQLVMQNYMMERLLERVSLSKYKQNFILKGGFLIAAIVGLDTRTTMDIDTTIKGFELTHDSIREIFEDICKIAVEDNVTFSVNRTTDIRESDDYPGIRVSLTANYSPLKVPMTVDVTTGDKITPREIEYSFRLLFEERSIFIMAYNLETILAEKLETVLSRNIANTRPRDFYDIHILYTLRGSECDAAILKNALEETAKKRGSLSVLGQYESIVDSIRNSSEMQDFWTNYQKEFDYAKDVSFDETCDMVLKIMKIIIA